MKHYPMDDIAEDIPKIIKNLDDAGFK